jgi:hypothetical protein
MKLNKMPALRKGATMTAANIVIENAVKFNLVRQNVKQLYLDGSKGGKQPQPTIGVRRGMLQRKLQVIDWQRNDRKRAKEFIHSLIKGMADTDSFMLAPIGVVLESLLEMEYDAPDETSRKDIQNTIADVEKDVKDGVEFYILDGQNRLFEAIIPFRDNKFPLSSEALFATDELAKERVPLAGKLYKDMPLGMREFIDNIQIYVHVAEKGDIESFIMALIAKNSNIAWVDWQILLTKNTFSKFRKQIGEVILDDEDNFIVDRVFNNITNAAYQKEKDGYELLISELLIWMATLGQPKKKSTHMQSQFFKGEDGMNIKDSQVASLKKYLREYASAKVTKKNTTHILVRNYVMLRYAMDNPKRFPKIALPSWKIEKGAEFVAQYIIACTACTIDPKAKRSILNLNGVHEKWDKVPGYLPYANSDYTKELLSERIRIISEKLMSTEYYLTTNNIVTKMSSDSMPPAEKIALDNRLKDYKGRTIYGTDVVTGVFDRGHVDAKATGGSNSNLQLQKPKSNKSYGKNSL